MRIVSMFTFRVFGWVGLHERACFYFLLRPVTVSATLSTAFLAEPLAWSARPSFFRLYFRSARRQLPRRDHWPCRCSCWS